MVVAALVPVSGAQAATTIGSNLTDGWGGQLNCTSSVVGCTATFGLTIPTGSGAPGGLTAPTSGVIVRWRLKTGPAPEGVSPAQLRVMRPGNSNTRGPVATSVVGTPVASSTNTFDTQLPIQAGDTIGVDSIFPPFASHAGSEVRFWSPKLADGDPASTSSVLGTPAVLLLNADIEADADNDGYGDETQDQCPTEASVQGGCVLTVTASEGGHVTGPGIDCPGDCTEAYPYPSQVALHVAPDKGFGISTNTNHQSCLGSATDCTVAMVKNQAVSWKFFDRKGPQTTITKAPPKRSSKRTIKIKFTSSEVGKFQCSLDKSKFKTCKSPYRKTLKPGRHSFQVSAIDLSHNPDFTPAKVRFRIEG